MSDREPTPIHGADDPDGIEHAALRALLRSQPSPAMPPEVAVRVQQAIADEARATTTANDTADPSIPDNTHNSGNVVSLDERRPRWRRALVGVGAAAAGIAIVGAVVLPALNGDDDSGSPVARDQDNTSQVTSPPVGEQSRGTSDRVMAPHLAREMTRRQGELKGNEVTALPCMSGARTVKDAVVARSAFRQRVIITAKRGDGVIEAIACRSGRPIVLKRVQATP